MKTVLPTLALALLSASAFADRNMDSSTPPNDSEIAQIVLTANDGEVDAGKLAEKKSMNPEVKSFANMMVTEHTSVMKQTKDLTKKLNVKPKDCPASKEMAKDAEKNEKKLKGLKGTAFDRAYVDQMVIDHQNVLDTIDHTLLPNAKNEELKALLTTVRPSVATHLDHAKELQAKLNAAHSG